MPCSAKSGLPSRPSTSEAKLRQSNIFDPMKPHSASTLTGPTAHDGARSLLHLYLTFSTIIVGRTPQFSTEYIWHIRIVSSKGRGLLQIASPYSLATSDLEQANCATRLPPGEPRHPPHTNFRHQNPLKHVFLPKNKLIPCNNNRRNDRMRLRQLKTACR